MPEDYMRRKTRKAFADRVEDHKIKVALLIGGEKTTNEALTQVLELHVVFLAVRTHSTTISHPGGADCPHPTKIRKAIGMLELWRTGALREYLPYRRMTGARNEKISHRETNTNRQEGLDGDQVKTKKQTGGVADYRKTSRDRGRRADVGVYINTARSRVDLYDGKCQP
jgi:hypothetical protein